MAQYNKEQVYSAIRETGLVPVFYNGDPAVAAKVAKACYDGGARVFEFTFRGPAALEVFKSLSAYVRENLPGMILGVGSISDGRSARKFIRLGANFVVGPQYVPGVRCVCRWRGIPYIPGCGTVSEVGRAQRAGCEVCKVFPGEVLGPAFVKALRAPMPWSRIMVTGGVKPERANLEAWFKAGVESVGMGGALFPKDVIAAGDWDRITATFAESLEIIKSVL